MFKSQRFLSPAFRVAVFAALFIWNAQAEPLRVFIRAGVKTHGPNQHDHPRFLEDWKRLLAERGMKVDGAMEFPSPEQLANTDVIVIYAQDGMNIVGAQRAEFEKFLQRGGGLVVLHDGVVSGDQHEWAKQVQGGAWRWDGERKTKWFEGEVGIYFVDTKHPITRGLSNFDWKDEIYYDLDMAPDVRVLATSFESVFILAPQLWTYEKTWQGGKAPYRAFVSIPGHEYDVFNSTHYRAMLLRGIAWAGKRSNPDEFCKPEEVSEIALRYPAGGPTQPEKAAAKLAVHPDFDLSLVASEPLIEKVISLDWAPDGKLWVAETPEYPGGRTVHKNDAPIFPARSAGEVPVTDKKENRPAHDRISWLEDTSHNGRMDRKHVFYEGLELVTSMVFHKDGVIVEQAPDILWLRDTHHSGKADKVETIFTGFGTSDTHAVINNMRWGPDGWIYSAIGYSGGSPKSGDGKKEFGRLTAGIIRFKPDGSALEQVASGSCNTWGFDFAPDGEMFYTTATCGEHLLHIAMPEKFLARGNVGGGVRSSVVIPDHQKVAPLFHFTRQAYLQIDWVGMFTAAAGACYYNGGAWPERWNHSFFLHEPTVNLVHQDVLTPQGATFLARKEAGQEDTEFFAGSDPWFRPIHSRVGPDGALYVVDWYNQAVVHNDTRGPAHGANNAATRPDRDHHFARIWRIQHKQAQKLMTGFSAKPAVKELVAGLQSPNGWQRMTAHRLLDESADPQSARALTELFQQPSAPPLARLLALNSLANARQMSAPILAAALDDPSPIIRKNALFLVADATPETSSASVAQITTHLRDGDPRAQLDAFLALGTVLRAGRPQAEIEAAAQAVAAAWPQLPDRYAQSAAIGCAAAQPLAMISAALRASGPETLQDYVAHVSRELAGQQNGALAPQLVIALSSAPASSDALKKASLEAMLTRLPANSKPEWTAELRGAFQTLLRSPNAGLAATTLPLITRWDTENTLTAELKPLVAQLRARFGDSALTEEERGKLIVNLVGVHRLDSQIVPDLGSRLGSELAPGLQKKIIENLGAINEPEATQVLLAAYPRVPVDLRDAVFAQLVTRTDRSRALVQEIADRKIELALLGPINLHRLRTHTDPGVAQAANAAIAAIRGPQQQLKDTLITQFRPIVEKPGGDVANGHKTFTTSCSVCHAFKGEGRDLAPNLTGMGAHGPADLLVHILDPNRQVEPNFYTTSIEMKDESTYDGIIARENAAEVVLRNASGDFNLRKADIVKRRQGNLSLMPEGFESLGPETMRDLLAYLCADEQRFRILDLAAAFTANNSQGVYLSRDKTEDAPIFRRYGLVKVGEVPFDVLHPQKAAMNLVVLRGGDGVAKTMPQRVQIKAGVTASRLHFLGGIGGWAWPAGGTSEKNLPVLKATLHFTSGATEEMVFRNGVEFADWIGDFDVPGSKPVPDLAKRGQVRVFSQDVSRREPIDTISLESYDNHIAPTLVAITAEIAASGSETGTGKSAAVSGETRTLIVGAGSSHDFQKWFLDADSKTLATTGAKVSTIAEPNDIDKFIHDLDVLYLSNNAPFTNPSTRRAILDFANAGRGLLLVHPALWYNWNDWPEYNRQLCGGGSRGHDRYAEFEVTVTDPNHPLMRGVPTKFRVNDELYWFEPDPAGTPIKVLATAHSPSKNRDYPMVFVVEHPKARIVGITLGHDGSAHDSPAYQALLKNALNWAAQK